tara:strand:- start:889 stop:1404 length:516 start_codon:yes stop_codon:yes gene_type:complete
MKANILIAGLILVGISFGCQDNSELEQRVTNLERRLAEVENRGINMESRIPQTNQVTSQQSAQTGPAPLFKFEQTEYDFGTVPEGEVVRHTFEFVNVGESPLIIQNATASCGCTVPSFSKTPIPVGGKGQIQVEFNSSGKPFQQNPIITITANTNPSISRLSIKGYVEPRA